MKLSEQFEKETGTPAINSQGEPDIDYVAWLEKKLQSRPALSWEVTEESLKEFAWQAQCIYISDSLRENRRRDFEKWFNENKPSLLKPQEPSQEAVRKAIEVLEKADYSSVKSYRQSINEAIALLKSTPPQEQRQGLSEVIVKDKISEILMGETFVTARGNDYKQLIINELTEAICQLSVPTSEEREVPCSLTQAEAYEKRIKQLEAELASVRNSLKVSEMASENLQKELAELKATPKLREASDEEIRKAAKESCKGNQHAMRYQPMLAQFVAGAKWMRDLLKGGEPNKPQSDK